MADSHSLLGSSREQVPVAEKRTERTLREQMNITDREIERRKMLVDFSEEEVKELVACKLFIEEILDDIVGKFYARLTSEPEIMLLIGDSETLHRLNASMRHYVRDLFAGYYDGEYVNARLKIGMVHKRIGVSPKLYLSGVRLLQSLLNTAIHQNSKADEAMRRTNALQKLLYFDISLVFDTYINSLMAEVAAAKTQVEDYAVGLEEVVARRTRQLDELSRRDDLTQLWNRRAFQECLRRDVATAQRQHTPLCLTYFDLNGFKALNDARGHVEGDKILVAVGAILREAIREADLACRYGGDEFCIIMPNTCLEEAKTTCERVIERFREKSKQSITLSIGVAQMGPDDFADSESLVKEADALMFKAKAKARKKPGFYIQTGKVKDTYPL